MINPESLSPSEQQIYGTRNKIGKRQANAKDKVFNPKTMLSNKNKVLLNFVLTQYSIRQGSKKYGNCAQNSVFSEFIQFHDFECFESKHRHHLTAAQLKNALESLSFLKVKRDKRMECRICEDGRKQWSLYRKEETSSLTAATESVMLTSVIDTEEERDIAIVDISGAILQ